jgi:predicted O-methyltransferase YrrM
MSGLPKFLSVIPDTLLVADRPALASEILAAREIRMKFLPAGWPEPYLNSIVRAFRLAEGAQSYLEVGSRDKGHLVWIASRLSPTAMIVDVDKVNFTDNEERCSQNMGAKQKYLRIIGDPLDPTTPVAISKRAKQPLFDVVFANFASYYDDALFEFSTYFEFVRPGGVLVINDAYWEGDSERKGKCQALRQIDTHLPVFCVHMDNPIHRFTPLERNGGEWGTLAIIQRPHE